MSKIDPLVKDFLAQKRSPSSAFRTNVRPAATRLPRFKDAGYTVSALTRVSVF